MFCSKGGSGIQRQCQQLSEWAVMREVVWCLMCPVSAHVFVANQKGQFSVREGITLCSLTPVSFALSVTWDYLAQFTEHLLY